MAQPAPQSAPSSLQAQCDASVPSAKVGVLLANLGTPDATDYWSVRRYLSEFLSDQRVVDYPRWLWQPLLQLVILSRRPFVSGEAYRSIWNEERDESPLLTITRQQCDKLAALLKAEHGERVEVDFCMRYGNPSTDSAVRRLQEKGCQRILFFPLYPQYAAPTTATACDQLFRSLMKQKWQPAVRTVPAYYADPGYVEALAASVAAHWQSDEAPSLLVASYHGVPKRYVEAGDPYETQCHATTQLLQQALGWEDGSIETTFQSKFGPEEWVGPATIDQVALLARQGHKHIAVVSPAFSADCVETLEEIQQQIQEAFLEAGGERFTYIACLNDRDDHMAALADIARNELSGWL